MLLEIILVILILSAFGGGFYYPGPAYGGPSLLHIVAVVLVLVLVLRLLRVGF